MAAFMIATRMKGETIDEITGAALAVRAKSKKIAPVAGAIDTCGTGGDGSRTYNISTAAALVTAACGVPVAKHGNRSITSLSGSSDVLSELAVNINADIDIVEKCLHEAGICFMMAPNFNPAMRHVTPIRKDIKIRSMFNLIGPLTNPASADYQLMGVYEKEWCEPIALVLKELGVKAAWVVHGSDGLDEITTTGSTYVAQLKDGEITTFEVNPEDAGIEIADIKDLRGGLVEKNARELRAVLSGKKGAYRDIVLLNSAAALLIVGKVDNLKDGVAMAAEAIDTRAASDKLKKLVEISGSIG
jgi:anthranilate phosphoribosyltransferase